MPQVDAALNGNFVPFGAFAISAPPESPKDCRNVKEPTGGYTSPADGLTVGVHQQAPVLIDGYHRAVAFMRWGIPRRHDCRVLSAQLAHRTKLHLYTLRQKGRGDPAELLARLH
jgi:hypothetical protein